MSDDDKTKTPNTATIKIAAKDSSVRNSGGGADPGPGDSAAAPSVAPELVDIPDAPTPSQLVVKSTATSHSRRGPKSVIMSSMGKAKSTSQLAKSSASASQMGPAASNKSAPREPTSSSKLTGPDLGAKSSVGPSEAPVFTSGPRKSGITGLNSTGPRSSVGAPKSGTGGPKSSLGAPKSGTGAHTSAAGGPKSSTGAPKSSTGAPTSATGGPRSAGKPVGSPASSGAVHDVDEEGEGEMEHPEEGGTPTASPAASGPPGGLSGLRGSSAVSRSVGGTDADAGASFNRLSTRAGSHRSPSATPSAAPSDAHSGAGADKKKKVTKFRYHKRITVRTSGKTSPSAIMDKVNKKDHQAGITPSTIDDMDPQELMKRAGIKATNKTHWRVRLRQTKRVTKNGQTSTQTKVAYRDSEGNKRVKTSLSPYCKHCGKKLEDCKCDTNS